MIMRRVHFANFAHKSDLGGLYNRDKLWVLWFGAYGHVRVACYARTLEDALEECAGWLEDNAPGIFCDDVVREEYERVKKLALIEHDEDKANEIAWEASEVDTISVCSGNHFINSWECGIALEDPSTKELADYVHDRS